MKNKKKVWKILLINISIVVFIILVVCFYTYKKKELEINEYRKYAIEYLYNNYREEFDLEFDSLGYKISQRANFDSNGLLFSEYNKEIRECVFIVKSKELPIVSYITVWKNITTNEIEIKEVDGKYGTDTSFNKNKEIYYEKMSIKKDLDDILQKNYNDYEVNYNLDESNCNQIYIKFNHSIIKELENDLKNLKQLMDLTKNINTTIKIEFLDYKTIYQPSDNIYKNKEKAIEEGFKKEKKHFNFVKEVYQYLIKNGFKNFSVEKEEFLYIHFDFIYNENAMKTNINELQDICQKYKEDLTLYFKHTPIYFNYNGYKYQRIH